MLFKAIKSIEYKPKVIELEGFEVDLDEFKINLQENTMAKELEIMKYIETEMIKTNEECGKLHFNCDLRLWQDKQLELETIERIYEELNTKFFDGKL